MANRKSPEIGKCIVKECGKEVPKAEMMSGKLCSSCQTQIYAMMEAKYITRQHAVSVLTTVITVSVPSTPAVKPKAKSQRNAGRGGKPARRERSPRRPRRAQLDAIKEEKY